MFSFKNKLTTTKKVIDAFYEVIMLMVTKI